jgi:hypothetical protein
MVSGWRLSVERTVAVSPGTSKSRAHSTLCTVLSRCQSTFIWQIRARATANVPKRQARRTMPVLLHSLSFRVAPPGCLCGPVDCLCKRCYSLAVNGADINRLALALNTSIQRAHRLEPRPSTRERVRTACYRRPKGLSRRTTACSGCARAQGG